jgi:hypothetical protein
MLDLLDSPVPPTPTNSPFAVRVPSTLRHRISVPLVAVVGILLFPIRRLPYAANVANERLSCHLVRIETNAFEIVDWSSEQHWLDFSSVEEK